jgi:hypothetical protein
MSARLRRTIASVAIGLPLFCDDRHAVSQSPRANSEGLREDAPQP